MDIETLKEKILQFKNEVKEYRDLLSESRDHIMPEIVRNFEHLDQYRTSLIKQYASLETYIKKFGKGPKLNDGVWNVFYSPYDNAFTKDTLIRVGPSTDAILNDLDYIIGKLENIKNNESLVEEKERGNKKNIFAEELIMKLPTDIQNLCYEFNFNYINDKNYSCILLLRRILPLSIVRKFQALNKENEIKSDGEYLDTKGLMGKIEKELSNKRIYNEIMNYKSLIDASQHSYTLNITPTDVEGTAIKVRIFLEDIFNSKN